MKDDGILKKLESIGDLPTLPNFAIEVNRMVDEPPTIDAGKLSKVIEKDQAMAAGILKIANSAFMGCRGQTCQIRPAIVRLGTTMVRDVVVSVSIINRFSNHKGLKGFDAKGFWTHSISVAITARHLAEETKLAEPDRSFIDGLLHDIGKLVLYVYFPEHFEKVKTLSRSSSLTFHEAEKKVLSTDHAKIGGELARIWKLPDHIAHAIEGHHEPKGNFPHLPLAKVVHLADAIVNSLAIDPNADLASLSLHPSVQEELAPHAAKATEFAPALSKEIEEALDIFLG